MRYVLAARRTLIIKGSASFRLVDGEATILDAPLERDRMLTVEPERQLPVEAQRESFLEIALRRTGEAFEFEQSTIPASWSLATDTLAELEQGTVMVIGATDVGKSTFCMYAANRLLRNHLRARIIDADVGQADIGPPTTIGCSSVTSFSSSLVDLKPEKLIFMGHTNPKRIESKLIHGMKRLSGGHHDSLTIINTDGWVLDPEAIAYKTRMISSVNPDLVVGMGAENELHPILSLQKSHSIAISTAKDVLIRSRSDRRAIRTANYRRHLESGRAQTIPLDEVNVLTPNGFPPIQSIAGRQLAGLALGLLDNDGYMLHFGILQGVENGNLKVYSKSVEAVRNVELGYVRLTTKGIELEYFEPQAYR